MKMNDIAGERICSEWGGGIGLSSEKLPKSMSKQTNMNLREEAERELPERKKNKLAGWSQWSQREEHPKFFIDLNQQKNDPAKSALQSN